MDQDNNVNTGMPMGDEETTEETLTTSPEMGENQEGETSEDEDTTPMGEGAEEDENTDEAPASDDSAL